MNKKYISISLILHTITLSQTAAMNDSNSRGSFSIIDDSDNGKNKRFSQISEYLSEYFVKDIINAESVESEYYRPDLTDQATQTENKTKGTEIATQTDPKKEKIKITAQEISTQTDTAKTTAQTETQTDPKKEKIKTTAQEISTQTETQTEPPKEKLKSDAQTETKKDAHTETKTKDTEIATQTDAAKTTTQEISTQTDAAKTEVAKSDATPLPTSNTTYNTSHHHIYQNPAPLVTTSAAPMGSNLDQKDTSGIMENLMNFQKQAFTRMYDVLLQIQHHIKKIPNILFVTEDTPMNKRLKTQPINIKETNSYSRKQAEFLEPIFSLYRNLQKLIQRKITPISETKDFYSKPLSYRNLSLDMDNKAIRSKSGKRFYLAGKYAFKSRSGVLNRARRLALHAKTVGYAYVDEMEKGIQRRFSSRIDKESFSRG